MSSRQSKKQSITVLGDADSLHCEPTLTKNCPPNTNCYLSCDNTVLSRNAGPSCNAELPPNAESSREITSSLSDLLKEVRACTLCPLLNGHRPVVQASVSARLLIIGQAPGRKVHESGIPWNDPSGDRLRAWLGLNRETFYDETRIAIVPMGLCYPGKGKSGDLPPRKECAPLWHELLFSHLSNIQLTLLIGSYAQNYYLPKDGRNLTSRVHAWQAYLPQYFPLVHPSPRNQHWLAKNHWFDEEVVPALKRRVHEVIF
ncbi:uracil-DNA glycosylase family protein [Marinibactrum halimedae]|uniref:Uracil-DNA glycosylase-like domain-containing protein n=1 Tax=Marinibactrum halimedae TaxID=1444977 RepID=A0AA37T4E5_9GAMM|nr:uracil-DNA glycosylase family protein [Marinibactrum halimedae]MCD9457550.1 uracil-DNA glycosylase family protein [Marinibactrum halimedae]GLS25396.1 hypothetical protein GCM10007877_11100 [Marinibactrum halimedae]